MTGGFGLRPFGLPDLPGLNWYSFGGRPGPTLYSPSDAFAEVIRRFEPFRTLFPFVDGLEVIVKSSRKNDVGGAASEARARCAVGTNLTLWSAMDCDRQLNDAGGLKSGQRLQCAESLNYFPSAARIATTATLYPQVAGEPRSYLVESTAIFVIFPM